MDKPPDIQHGDRVLVTRTMTFEYEGFWDTSQYDAIGLTDLSGTWHRLRTDGVDDFGTHKESDEVYIIKRRDGRPFEKEVAMNQKIIREEKERINRDFIARQKMQKKLDRRKWMRKLVGK